jgi:hypothetical protein
VEDMYYEILRHALVNAGGGTTALLSFFCCCCCLLLQALIQSCACGGRRIVENMCYEKKIPNPDSNPNLDPQMSLKDA